MDISSAQLMKSGDFTTVRFFFAFLRVDERNGDFAPIPILTRRYTPGEMGYWSIVEPVWDAINIYDGPEVFAQTFASAPRTSGLLFAAHFCQSEICNGGFGQFFGNSTGVLAPEAVEGFREIGQVEVAALIEKAVSLFGSVYPRDRNERETRLAQVSRSSLDALDEMFYSLIDSEAGGFIAAADRYAATVKQHPSSPEGI